MIEVFQWLNLTFAFEVTEKWSRERIYLQCQLLSLRRGDMGLQAQKYTIVSGMWKDLNREEMERL